MIETIILWILGIFGAVATIFMLYYFSCFLCLVIRDEIRNRKKRRTE